MLIAMVFIFGTSWFPINLINLVADSVDLGKNQNFIILHALSRIITDRVLVLVLPFLLPLPRGGHVLHLLQPPALRVVQLCVQVRV